MFSIVKQGKKIPERSSLLLKTYMNKPRCGQIIFQSNLCKVQELISSRGCGKIYHYTSAEVRRPNQHNWEMRIQTKTFDYLYCAL